MLKLRLMALTALAMLAGPVAAVPGAGVASQATPAGEAAGVAPTTAILVAATNDPLRVAGSDGVDHLEYDLLVTNAFLAPVTLTTVEVIVPDGETLLRLDGETLAAATQPLLGAGPISDVPASGTVAVVIDVVVPPDRALERLTHRVAFDVASDAPLRSIIGTFEIAGPELAVDPRPATVIAPPLRGGGWLAANACCSPAANHRAFRLSAGGAQFAKAETFAIDWVRLRDGKLFEGDGSAPEQWFGFGAEVYAVADGTVVAVEEGRPEEVPMQPVANVHQPRDFGGNFVTLEIAPGVYAFYAHLQPGSVTVGVGDRVPTGQVLGLLGNTGNTTGPHLHFALLDAPDPLTGNSLPMAFDRWTLEGVVPPEASSDQSGPPNLAPVGTPAEQSATLQLFMDVADFG